MEQHRFYNRDNFPRLVWAEKGSNWHIYADVAGNCAAIPVEPGCEATHFGTLAHVANVKRRKAAQRDKTLAERCKLLWRWLPR